MKSKFKFVLFQVSVMSFLIATFVACQKDSNDSPVKPVVEAAFADVENEYFNIIGVADNKEMVAVKANKATGIPEIVVHQRNDDPGTYLKFTEEGFPDFLYHNEVFFLFANIRETMLDVAILYDDHYEIFRDVEWDGSFFFSDYFLNLKSNSGWGSTALKVAGHGLNVAMCVAALKAAAWSAGALAPAAKVACGSAITGLMMEGAGAISGSEAVQILLTKAGITMIATPGDVIVALGSIAELADQDVQQNEQMIFEINEELTVIDILGVTIGNQVWMKKNINAKVGNYWSYNNDPEMSPVYGKLYDWETALTVCPEGWRLPSADDFNELINFLGGNDVAGGKMKTTGTMIWEAPNTGATNSSGFSALPVGDKSPSGDFFLNFGKRTNFWTTTTRPDDEWSVRSYGLRYDEEGAILSWSHPSGGNPVRCILNK